MVALRQILPDAPPKNILSIREFTGEGGDELLNLRGCYEKFLLPSLEARENTLRAYQTALNHWERITPDPAVEAIDDELCQKFLRRLGELTSTENSSKVWTAIRPILRRIGPRETGNPAGLGIIRFVPYARTKKRRAAEKRILSLDELDRLWRACNVVQWPVGLRIPAPLWWRTALVVDSNYGMRTGDLVKQRPHHVGLRWDAVRSEPRCPYHFVQEVNAEGWIVYCPEKTSEFKPEPLHLPMLDVVARHLEEISAYRRHLGESLILPAPTHPKALRRELSRISKAAGIDPPVNFKHLRTTANYRWDSVELGLGSLVLGHAARSVNAKHYAVSVGHLVRAASKIEQPEAFKGPLS